MWLPAYDASGSASPETYLGSQRQQGYDGTGSYADGTRAFTATPSLKPYYYDLSGTWTIASESITAGSGAAITLRYHASEVYLDVGGTGTLTVTEGGSSHTIRVSGAPDIYTVAGHDSPQDGTVAIGLSPGLRAYSFIFG